MRYPSGTPVNCVDTSGGGSGTVGIGTTGWNAYYAGNGSQVTASSAIFTDTNGNIGIGTSSPQSDLEIYDSLGYATLSGTDFILTSTTDNGSAIEVDNTGSFNYIGITTNNDQNIKTALYSNSGIGFSPNGASPISFMQTNGNLGISSIFPSQKLDVNGTVRSLAFMTPTGLSTQFLKANGSVDTTAYGTGSVTSVTLASPNSTMTYGGTNPVTTSGTINGDFNLSHSNSWTAVTTFNGTPNAVITGSGNVGINQSSPQTLLDVNGSIRVTGFALNSSPVSGYILMGNGIGIGTWVPASSMGGGVTSITGDTFFHSNSSSTGAVTLTNATHTQNTVIGSATSTAPADLTMPSCSTATSALKWTTSTGFGCNTISAGTNYWNSSSGVQNVGINTVFNVGIGSTTPNAILDVEGSVNAAVFMAAATGSSSGPSGVGIGTFSPAGNLDVEGTVRGIVLNGLLNSNANVGIGSFNPTSELDVHGTIGNLEVNASGNVGIGTYANQTALSVMSGNVGIGTISPTGVFEIAVPTGSTPAIFVSSAGNVSIGTKTAGSSFVVGTTGQTTFSNGNITTNQVISSTGVNGFTNNNANASFKGTSNTAGSLTTYQGGISSTSSTLIISNGSVTGTTDNIQFLLSNSTINAMQIQDMPGASNGSVGIGSSSPTGAILDVEGTLPIVFFAQKTGVAKQNVGIGSYVPSGMLDVEGTLSPIVFDGTKNANTNVGIGTYWPGQLLDVGGTIRITASTGQIFGAGEVLDVQGTIQPSSPGYNANTASTNFTLLDVQGTLTPFYALTVNSNSNVGIGSLTPGAPLDVQGTIRFPGLKAASGYRYLCISSTGVLESQSVGCVGT